MSSKKKRFTKLEKISLKAFDAAVGRVAKSKGREYWNVSVETNLIDKKLGVVLRGYIDGIGSHTAKSVKEVCDHLAGRTMKSKVVDVNF